MTFLLSVHWWTRGMFLLWSTLALCLASKATWRLQQVSKEGLSPGDKQLTWWVSYTNSSHSTVGPDGPPEYTTKHPQVVVNQLDESERPPDMDECGNVDLLRTSPNEDQAELLMTCLKRELVAGLKNLTSTRPTHVDLLGGWLRLERTRGQDVSSGDEGRRLAEEGREINNDLLVILDDFTKSYAFRIDVFPGLGVRMSRSQRVDAVNYAIQWDSDAQEGRAQDTNKNKKKKKSDGKDMKKIMALMMVPMLIQAIILPFMLASMKFMLLKALLAGKLAIILIVVNAVRAAAVRTSNDVYHEEMAAGHYGYDGGPEYGAWFNRRTLQDVAYRQ